MPLSGVETKLNLGIQPQTFPYQRCQIVSEYRQSLNDNLASTKFNIVTANKNSELSQPETYEVRAPPYSAL